MQSNRDSIKIPVFARQVRRATDSQPRKSRLLLAWASFFWLISLSVGLNGCGESVTIQPPEPPQSILVGVEQNKVIWSVDQPTRGAVRYGFISGEYDRIAYPLPDDRADKVYSNGHEVPLLSAVAGTPIFIQRTDLTEAGQLFAAAEETVVFDSVPAEVALLTMTSIDVQFGDAHVLQLPSENKIVMIDAGNPYVSRRGQTAPQHVRRWLDDRAINRIDVAMVSHVHADHYGGFLWGADAADNGILELYEVGLFLDVSEVSGNGDRHADLQALMSDLNIPHQVITPGMSDQTDPELLSWDPSVRVLVLNAGSQAEWANISHTGTRINNDSIVLKFNYGEVDIITGGDCEVEGEARILNHFSPQLDEVELFKAHHHGRYDANSLEFLTVIAPRIAFIPVAFAAYYEGPDQGAEDTAQTLAHLAVVQADVFRFDAAEPLARENDNRTFWHTTFVTDGVSYEVRIAPSIWGI